MPGFFDHAAAATLTAFDSAGPELPTSMVSSFAWLFAGAPNAVPAATAQAQMTTNGSASRLRFPAFQWNFT
jgi:hypothetical protein